MSISHQHAPIENWRTIDIDALDPDAPPNFDTRTLHPALGPPPTEADVRSLGQRARGLLRSGDTAGALQAVLAEPPYGAGEAARDAHLATVVEVLQGIRAGEMVGLLRGLGGEEVDVLVKYLYKGMSASSVPTKSARVTPQSTGFSQVGGRPAPGESSGSAMSVLLSWHEKVIEVAGLGPIGRCMSDWRKV